jgi:hypothetical protein
MGWEVRHGGRRYLYRNRRVNGQPVKEYLAADDRFGFGQLVAHDLARVREREAQVRALERQTRATFRIRLDGILVTTAAANADLRTVAEGILHTVGYHQHHRGEWRMRRVLKDLKAAIGRLEEATKKPAPLVRYTAPDDDAVAVELFAKARAGDETARDQVHALIRDRNWVSWLGDLGRQATGQLICAAAGGDAVWEAGITEKANALRAQLLGPNPSVLEELLVRRVVNGWVAVHTLELELTIRRPANPRDREYLDRALTRAQKRFTEAAGALARVRRLAVVAVLAAIPVETPAAPPVPLPPGS